MRKTSENEMKNIMGYTEEAVVSQDFVGDARTSVFDAGAGMELNPRFFKIISWYDNECGYSNKLIDLAKHIHSL
jgi:glyceraldehyde 3-phosphate dehydrogenase